MANGNTGTANARLWIRYQGAWVKLTLRPEERIEFGFHAPTEEGFRSEGCILEHNGAHVSMHRYYRSRDCDGVYSGHSLMRCPLDNLHSVDVDVDGETFRRPDWKELSRLDRDHAAEDAGY